MNCPTGIVQETFSGTCARLVLVRIPYHMLVLGTSDVENVLVGGAYQRICFSGSETNV